MIITITAKYYETLEIASRLEAQLIREACVVSRPLILRTLVGMDVPESVRRLQRSLQSIYHGVESVTGRRNIGIWDSLYLHVSPDEARLLRVFMDQTSAADLHGRFDERVVGRVGTLAVISPAWEAMRARWASSLDEARPKQHVLARTEAREGLIVLTP